MTIADSAEATGLWLSVTEIAKARGVEKSSISRRVARLEAAGFDQIRAAGGKKLINLAAFDRATGEMTDEVREMNGSRNGAGLRKASGLAAEQMRKTAYQADLAQMELAERQGKLLPIEDVHAASARAGEVIVRALERLPMRADEIAIAATKEGSRGVRQLLKQVVFEARRNLAAALMAIGKDPTASEPAAWPKSPDALAALEAETQTRLNFVREGEL